MPDNALGLLSPSRADLAPGDEGSVIIAADALRVVQVDVTRVGGVTEWLQVAHHAAASGLRLVPHAGDMMQVHQHLVGTVPSESPPLAEFIPWTQQVFENPSIVQDGFVERPQAPGASTTITEQARQKWQVKGVGTTTTQD
jgi:L-alanine-DL-glutamate epimerase-like enolase superfamily enzyme